MSEKTSRALLAVQAALICLPLSALFVALVLPSSLYFATFQSDPMSLGSAGASVLILATLVCAWRLIGAFMLRGRMALRAAAASWWILPALAAVLGLLAALHVALAPVLRPSAFNVFALGLPCALPLAHLSWERWWLR